LFGDYQDLTCPIAPIYISRFYNCCVHHGFTNHGGKNKQTCGAQNKKDWL